MDVRAADRADVVVIGGGIVGCNAAYHLHQAGAGHVVLLERAPDLGTQTSWAGAGFVSLWGAEFPHWTELEVEMEQYALGFYRQLDAEHDIGLKAVGMARIAVGPEWAHILAARYERARSMVAPEEVRLLSPQEVGEVVPVVEPARICAGLFWPTAIRINASGAVRALGRELQAMGVEVRTGTAVTAIETAGGRVRGLQTSGGRIAADVVVNAAGAWLAQVGRMAGVVLPATPRLATRFVTEPISGLPADLPLMIFADYHDMWVREDDGGLMAGAYYDEEVRDWRRVPAYPPPDVRALPAGLARQAEVLARHAERLAHVFAPTLRPFAQVRLKEVRSGLPAYTDDGRHLLGPVATVAGCYVVGGDNEAGISHGPGLGRLLAELVVQGTASRDLAAYRLDRFPRHDQEAPSGATTME